MNGIDQNIEEEEIRARAFLDELDDELNKRRANLTLAEWNFTTNITKENEEYKEVLSAANAEFTKVYLCAVFIFFYRIIWIFIAFFVLPI